MPDEIFQSLKVLEQALEIIGAFSLVLGFVIATVRCFRQSLRYGAIHALTGYRQSLRRVTLIGLEVLVTATIIKTITLQPTLENIGFLAIIVVIRTLLSWTTVLEMSGRWPWQKPRAVRRL